MKEGMKKNNTFSLVTGNQTTFSKDYISDTPLNHILLDYLEKKNWAICFLLPEPDYIEVNKTIALILVGLNFTLFKILISSFLLKCDFRFFLLEKKHVTIIV